MGHFVQMMVMAHMQRAGHRPVALLGGGTAIGRRSYRKNRYAQNDDTGNHSIPCGLPLNSKCPNLLIFQATNALMVNNADWLMNLNYVEFLREIGVHFSVNRMLAAECFKSRMERGLSFLEFNYMLMQGYDFYYLNQEFGCTMELGGDDQWSNILGGVELCRKKAGKEVYGMTFALLTTSEGKKMGENGKGRGMAQSGEKHPPMISSSTGGISTMPMLSNA